MTRWAGLVLGVGALLLLTGCAAPRPVPETPAEVTVDAETGSDTDAETDADTETAARAAWQAHRARLDAIDGWNLKGRIAVQTGRKSGSATLLWERARDRQTIQLHGPFGGGRIRITAQPGRAELRDSRGRMFAGAHPAEVLRRHTGWRLPFAQLRRWVRGLPGAGARDIVVDGRGRVKRFSEGDWRVAYQNYAAVGGLDLPQRLSVTARPGRVADLLSGDGDRDRLEVGDRLNVRLVISRWRDLEVAGAP